MNTVFIAKATGTAIRVSGGASLELVESEGCSPVSVVGLVRLCSVGPGRLTTLLPTGFRVDDQPEETRVLKAEMAAPVQELKRRGDGREEENFITKQCP